MELRLDGVQKEIIDLSLKLDGGPFAGENIHTYIHTLLARPHGAFQSQFYITKL